MSVCPPGFRALLVALALAVLVGGCAPSISVHTDYQPGTNFSAYRTFTLGNDGDLNPLAIQRIRTALVAQLTAKGLSQAQSDGDLSVRVHVRMRVDTKVDVWSSGWGYGYYGGNYVDVRNVPMGTLVVDLVDRAKSQAVWRGVAESTVDQNATPQESEQHINAALEKMFRDFPPKG